MSSELIDVLRLLLGDDPKRDEIEDLPSWWRTHREMAQPFGSSVGRACAAGFAADRIAYAFASGYEEALAALVPSLQGSRVALCATEAGGGHPRAIEAALEEIDDRFRVIGEKTYVTLGDFAEELLVVVSIGKDDHERNRLRVARLPVGREGIRLEHLPETPFVPELPHAKLHLEGVRVMPDELLDGDGYDEYLKPFRTVEDIHVVAAICAHLIRVGRLSKWDKEPLDELASLVAALFSLGLADPNDAALHVALGGLFDQFRQLEAKLDWSTTDSEIRDRYQRDRTLLSVADSVRAKRLSTAWSRLGS